MHAINVKVTNETQIAVIDDHEAELLRFRTLLLKYVYLTIVIFMTIIIVVIYVCIR